MQNSIVQKNFNYPVDKSNTRVLYSGHFWSPSATTNSNESMSRFQGVSMAITVRGVLLLPVRVTVPPHWALAVVRLVTRVPLRYRQRPRPDRQPHLGRPPPRGPQPPPIPPRLPPPRLLHLSPAPLQESPQPLEKPLPRPRPPQPRWVVDS